MDSLFQEDRTNERQSRLLTLLEQLQELPVSAVHYTFDLAVQQVREALAADLVAFYFKDVTSDVLVARYYSSSSAGRKKQVKEMPSLPLTTGGNVVETFLSGVPFLTEHIQQQNTHEPPDAISSLGMNSQMAAVFRVQTQHRGVVLAASLQLESFTPQDISFLNAIARWTGLLVGRKELVEQMHQHKTTFDQTQGTEQLLTIMAHELRNYVQPLQGRLDLLLERAKHDERAKDIRDVESCLRTLDLLSRNITNVVDMARLRQGLFALAPVSLDLCALVHEVVSSLVLKPSALVMRSPSEVVVSADPQRMHQALETMLLYAMNAFSTLDEMTIDITIERWNDGLWVSLKMYSRGTAPYDTTQSHIPPVDNVDFTRLGVQLSLTNQIALAHHGTFAINTVTANECRLTFAFPVEEEDLSVCGVNELRVII